MNKPVIESQVLREPLAAKGQEVITDIEVLRNIMAAIVYGEIRHEKFLQHDLSNVEPEVLYRSVFIVVDGLLEASKK